MLLPFKQIFTTTLVISLLCVFNTYAQNPVYTGKLLDLETKKPLDTAVITVLASGDTYFTNEKGVFEIPELYHSTVIISHYGYENLETKLSKGNQTIYLLPTIKKLDEVLIHKANNINDIDIRNSTGSVITVDMAQLSQRSELDMAKLLQGQVPGLTVNYSGELGQKPEIRLRGNSSFNYKRSANSPLFVMDGIIISTETFMTLNPNDFTTIKVLKDAPATALYGIKAANGVIELTSKKGFDGKPVFSFSMKQGVTLRGERPAKMMGTQEKLAFEERIENPASPGFLNSAKYINKAFANNPNLERELARGARTLDSLKQINTDWFKELIKPNTFQSYNLGVRGGTDKNTYFYSVNYSKQGGRIPGNDINQITARANLDYKLAHNFALSFNNSFGLSTANTENGMSNDPTSLAFSLNPYETKNSAKLFSQTNNLAYNNLINQYKEKTTTKRFSTALIIHWDILPELNISGVVGGDYSLAEKNKRILSTAYSQNNLPTNAKGYISEGDNKTFDLSSNIRVNYTKQFGDHSIYAGINMDYYLSQIKDVTASGYGISDDINSLSGINNGLTGDYAPKASGNKLKNAQLGFGTALGYSYQDTYDLYGSFKRDGSSLLPSNKRWNDAWSTGIGWSVSQYEFFQRQGLLTALKFKGSIGYTASMEGITPSAINTTYSNNNSFYGEYRLLQLLALPNKDLKPQQTYTTNLSMDLGFVGRFNLLVNLYKNTTKEAIMASPIATSNGFSLMTKNIGELENKGIEFMLSGDIIRLSDFRWNTSASISHNKNVVSKLYGTDRIYESEQSIIPTYEVGKSLGIIYGIEDNGIHPITGLPEYLDRDNKVISYNAPLTAHYFRNYGNTIAPYNGFFNNYLSYKNWSLAVNVNYAFGGKAVQSGMYVRDLSKSNMNALAGQLDNMWFEVGDENKTYPMKQMPSNVYALYDQPSSRKIYKTDYIKLNYIQLGYSITQSGFINRYFKSLQVNIQADNIYTFRFEKDKGGLNDVIQPILTFSLNATF